MLKPKIWQAQVANTMTYAFQPHELSWITCWKRGLAFALMFGFSVFQAR